MNQHCTVVHLSAKLIAGSVVFRVPLPELSRKPFVLPHNVTNEVPFRECSRALFGSCSDHPCLGALSECCRSSRLWPFPWSLMAAINGKEETEAEVEVLDPRKHRGKDYKRLDGLSTCLEDRDPASTLVAPAMRVHVGLPGGSYGRTLTGDDVLIVPELLCAQEELSLYHSIVQEIQNAQEEGGERYQMGFLEGWLSSHQQGAGVLGGIPNSSGKDHCILQDLRGIRLLALQLVCEWC
eukprot:s1500_g14.t1